MHVEGQLPGCLGEVFSLVAEMTALLAGVVLALVALGERSPAPGRARYLADETYRRRISRQLNKGENLHALRRSLAYADEGALRRRHRLDQRT
ncbi:transposase [Streptosporangium sp. NBC_01639]|uniref:Tn3 family transposase n=1 Tax=Streptosporangium sp. NBC_01639 TaxID=2975948 RepID=UPI003869F099|nr:transposase [Streptosporangium sp. NBC_01639]